MRLFLLMLAACASAPALPGKVPRCVTPCGMEADFPPKACAELMDAERRAIDAYATNVKEFSDKAAACRALDGWAVAVHVPLKADKSCDTGDRAWVYGMGLFSERLCVIGYTYFAAKLIELTDERTRANAFTHEIGHV